MAQTTSEIDSGSLGSVLKAHLMTLYAAADVLAENQTWANHFTENTVVKKGADEVIGRENARQFLVDSWQPLKGRKHIMHNMYPLGKSGLEAMLYGTSEFYFKDGREKTSDWAALVRFVSMGEGKVEIDYYRIYMEAS